MGDDPETDTAQTPKRLDGRLALREKIRKTFTDSIPKNTTSQLKLASLYRDRLAKNRMDQCVCVNVMKVLMELPLLTVLRYSIQPTQRITRRLKFKL